MLTITCVLRSGGIYGADWVARLQRNVAAFAAPHRFVCLSDLPVPCESIPLIHGWPGWWSKIELFRPGLFKGRVLFLDLDCLVTGPLDLLTAGGQFRSIKDWWRPGFNSSVMAWDAGDSEIYERFSPACMGRLHGDQDWINLVKRPEADHYFAPGAVVSFKADCRQADGSSRLPDDARVVAFHGQPKPPDVRDQWVADLWNA